MEEVVILGKTVAGTMEMQNLNPYLLSKMIKVRSKDYKWQEAH
jgi:hypothetical protein